VSLRQGRVGCNFTQSTRFEQMELMLQSQQKKNKYDEKIGIEEEHYSIQEHHQSQHALELDRTRASSASLAPSIELIDLANDLRKLLYDEKNSDIYLRGTDGGRIPAVSAILSARSPSFRRRLQEIDSTGVTVLSFRYNSSVLGAIVEYCYTGSVDSSCYPDDEATARMYVGVYDAAEYFELPRLRKVMLKHNHHLLARWRPLACPIFDEALLYGDSAKDIAILSRKIICMNPEAVLLTPEDDGIRGGGVLSLSTSSLSRVITSDDFNGEWTKFCCLKVWVNNAPDKKSTTDRRAVAQKLIMNIQFSRIQPSDLSGVVASSGLVSSEHLLDAYKHQAFLAERDGDIRDFFEKRSSVYARGGIMIVHGAGVNETNGVYVSSTNKDLLMYSMQNIYQNKEVTFYLYRSKPYWYLGLTQGERPVHFYRAPIQQENCNLPPTQGWRVVCEDDVVDSVGIEPAPSMIWISESSDLDDYRLNNKGRI